MDLVGGPWPRHLPYDDAREREKFQRGGLGCGMYFVEVRTDTRRSWLHDPPLWRGYFRLIYFILQILKKTTCIILKESEEQILHKDTLINQPDQTLKLNKIGIPFGYPFMRLLTGTVISYTEIPDASPQNYTYFTGNICSFLSQTF